MAMHGRCGCRTGYHASRAWRCSIKHKAHDQPGAGHRGEPGPHPREALQPPPPPAGRGPGSWLPTEAPRPAAPRPALPYALPLLSTYLPRPFAPAPAPALHRTAMQHLTQANTNNCSYTAAVVPDSGREPREAPPRRTGRTGRWLRAAYGWVGFI
jgi:hypothetical protein